MTSHDDPLGIMSLDGKCDDCGWRSFRGNFQPMHFSDRADILCSHCAGHALAQAQYYVAAVRAGVCRRVYLRARNIGDAHVEVKHATWGKNKVEIRLCYGSAIAARVDDTK